jgi:hypothetical protein
LAPHRGTWVVGGAGILLLQQHCLLQQAAGSGALSRPAHRQLACIAPQTARQAMVPHHDPHRECNAAALHASTAT